MEVKIHEYKEGSPGHKPYFVELWDIGGNNSYKGARHLFYSSFQGSLHPHFWVFWKSSEQRWVLSKIYLTGIKYFLEIVLEYLVCYKFQNVAT